MGAINIRKMGLAVGSTLAVLRILCLILFSVVSRDQAIAFVNTLLCGIDIGPILTMDLSPVSVVYGIVQIFILGWLFGALMAGFYNLQLGCCTKKGENNGACCH